MKRVVFRPVEHFVLAGENSLDLQKKVYFLKNYHLQKMEHF